MKPGHIIHLDDHSLVTIGNGKLLKKVFPEYPCHGFTNTGKAWRFIRTLLLTGEKVDLIITDFIHPGPNGYEFAKNIRELEIKKNFQPVLIILLTLIDETEPLVKMGLKTKIFTSYQSLAASETELTQTFRYFVAS